ncbi:two-component sensor histidine kinase [Kribbella sp. ALI-6-A]|uniref:sensor histidine kinase n=1 Tax=Kribbella sp. ALI-6-A TaxID=1933817 RepID=UPI00097BCBB8|nr:sensor histidine kinase [Kribbella sp. ALI-6-A]ONI72263.1 two-component sensor histidine kinase [Kribbella sp. ALI-6-A]
MLRNAVRSLWAEPRAPHPPRRVWRDWVLVGLLVPTAIVEGVLHDPLVWRPVATLLGVVFAVALLWRRTHPFAVVAGTFGSLIVLDLAILLTVREPVGLTTMIFVVLLPYALWRWGSGREIGIGTVLVLVTLALGLTVDRTGLVDSVLGSMFLLFPATLGAAVRYRASARVRELDQVRLREREQLARELHDTVAHHVSAIAIRAQAGRVVAVADPGAAVDALVVIEAEASRTLTEMRIMVAGLRADEAAALGPQPGVADLEQLARSTGPRPRVELELSGDLDDLGPSVDAAVYRIAQESITNAVRHARDATRIDVRVAADADCVRLTVRDDGEAGSAGPVGYGLVGMTERATLLGGSFEAGPGPDKGWTVEAVLPKSGAAG